MNLRLPSRFFAACLAASAFSLAAEAAQYGYVATGGSPHEVSIIDLDSRSVVSGPVEIAGRHVAAAVSADGERLYALSSELTSSGIGEVTVIATAGGAVVGSFSVGRNAQDIVTSPDGAKIYVANATDRSISVIDASTLQQSTLVLPICAARLAIAPDSRHLYAACGTEVLRIDTQTMNVGAPRRVFIDDSVVAMAIHPDGEGLWMLATRPNGHSRLAAVFAASLDTAWTLDFAQFPRALAVNPDGRSVYVGLATIAPTGELVAINPETKAVRSTLPMPEGPRSIAISQDGRHAFMTMFLGPVAIVDLQLGSVSGRIGEDASYEKIVVGPGPLSRTTRLTIVEFHHEKLDHYFVTGYANEIDDLDNGVHAGWKRTGFSFDAFQAGLSRGHGGPVCRFYGKPSAGLDSHFYSGHRSECDAVVRRFPDAWQLEGLAVFDATLPNLVTGQCPFRMKPVYRLWNQRSDSNHRYTTSREIASAMRDQGYVSEGYGPDGVALCAVDRVP